MTDETFYKVLNLDGTSCNGGDAQWFLPHGKRPGKWMPEIKTLVPCESGYHICRRGQLVQWLGPAIYEVEFRGEIVEQSDKCVASSARLIRKLDNWTERTARLFACDCAEEALKLIQEPDPRSIEAVRVARLYAGGEAKQEQLAAARYAAWAAARDAARHAAWAAARDAARYAARAAAWAAARYAARDAAWEWQTERLFDYLEGRRR